MNSLKEFVHMLHHVPDPALKERYQEIRSLIGADTPAFFERIVGALL